MPIQAPNTLYPGNLGFWCQLQSGLLGSSGLPFAAADGLTLRKLVFIGIASKMEELEQRALLAVLCCKCATALAALHEVSLFHCRQGLAHSSLAYFVF